MPELPELHGLTGVRGAVAAPHGGAALIESIRLAFVQGEPPGTVVEKSRNAIYRAVLPQDNDQRGDDKKDVVEVAWKQFGRQNQIKNVIDSKGRGSKARRSFETAEHLQAHGVGTPEPIAWADRWDGSGGLTQSFFLSVFEDDMVSFKDEFLRLWRKDPPLCRHFMMLLETVAQAVRKLHDAGVAHNDLGNQNILMRRVSNDTKIYGAGPGADEAWADVQFIDLNRARLHDGPLPLAKRARDLSRISLPSDLRRVFFEMVFAPAAVPRAFIRAERAARRRFDFHTNTRRWRHPIRTRKNPPVPTYPAEKNLYIWDDRSVQAIPPLRSRERRKHIPFSSHRHVLKSGLKSIPAVLVRQAEIRKTVFSKPVAMRGRIGLTDEAGRVPVDVPEDVPLLLRFYHHESRLIWTAGLAQLHALHAAGHHVAAALVQCRKSVLAPSSWTEFAQMILRAPQMAVADFVEIGHAINRSKWGLWHMDEYHQLLQTLDLRSRNNDIPIAGPAVIDWELHYLAAALDVVPPQLTFNALSHHLYVDRRGAPENKQGRQNLLGKLAGIRAAAQCSPRCENKVYVTEVNWPLKGTGAWSPVTSPYDSPGPRDGDPSVDEETYSNYMLRYLLLAICSGLADRVYWWKLDAEGFGLRDGKSTPRPAYYAFVHLLATIGNATFLERLPSKDDEYILRFDNGVTVAWTTGEPRPVPIAFREATDLTGRPLDTPLLIDSPLYLHA